MTDYQQLESEYSFDVYPKREVVIVRGKGAKVWDDRGNEYIDCVAGHGVASLGHGNEKIAEAISAQARRLITCSGIFYNDTRATFLEKLIDIAPPGLKKAFLCNSGTEAIEAALKFARFTTGRTDFIAAMKGFHGRTMGALSATYNPNYRSDFEPLVPGFKFVPFNDFAKLKEQVNKNMAAIILEIIQGEGGVYVGERDYFDKVMKLCREENILLIIDEIQTGFCRTGKMFAVDHFNLTPDILCVAKAIAGGVPMGAVLCSEKIAIPIGKHGSTFGGNPLACAAGIAAIDFMQQNQLAQQAQEKGNYFLNGLRKMRSDKIREVRGMGLMVGVELKEKVKPYLLKLINQGVLTLPAGATILRFLPPLIIEYEELDLVLNRVQQVLTQ